MMQQAASTVSVFNQLVVLYLIVMYYITIQHYTIVLSTCTCIHVLHLTSVSSTAV